MDFLSGLAKGGDKPTSDQPKNPDNKENTSATDLFGSAKVVAEAAQAQFRNEPEKYDKAKAAGAGADLLQAASEYGKLDETKGIGKYVDQAEDYLRQYNTSGKSSAASAPAEKKPTTTDAPAPAVDDKTTTTAADAAEKPSGGAGDYIKMAEGFLNKPSGDGGEKTDKPSSESGGYGDMMKMAGSFLNK